MCKQRHPFRAQPGGTLGVSVAVSVPELRDRGAPVAQEPLVRQHPAYLWFLCHCQFNFTLYVCAEILHMMNINMPASVGAPPLDTTTVYIVQDFHYYYTHAQYAIKYYLHCVTLDVAISKEGKEAFYILSCVMLGCLEMRLTISRFWNLVIEA